MCRFILRSIVGKMVQYVRLSCFPDWFMFSRWITLIRTSSDNTAINYNLTSKIPADLHLNDFRVASLQAVESGSLDLKRVFKSNKHVYILHVCYASNASPHQWHSPTFIPLNVLLKRDWQTTSHFLTYCPYFRIKCQQTYCDNSWTKPSKTGKLSAWYP